MIESITSQSKLLAVSLLLEERGDTPFSLEKLAVTAWQQFPDAFGITGYDHPDVPTIISYVTGETGLLKKGMVHRKGNSEYTLSPEGRKKAYKIIERIRLPVSTNKDRAKLIGHLDDWLVRVLKSTAVSKTKVGWEKELTATDAFEFWNVRPSAPPKAFDKALTRCEDHITQLERMFRIHNTIILNGGREVMKSEMELIARVHRFLDDKYHKLMTFLARRNQTTSGSRKMSA